MNEKKLQWIEASKILWVVAFAMLYAWGGIEDKWLRRYLAPVVLTIGMFVYSRNWKTLLQAPAMMLTLSFGYGGDSTLWKVLRRGFFGLMNGASSSTFNIIMIFKSKPIAESYEKVTHIVLTVMQIILLIFVYIGFGVFNPFGSARAEEFIIGALVALIPMMGTKVKVSA